MAHFLLFYSNGNYMTFCNVVSANDRRIYVLAMARQKNKETSFHVLRQYIEKECASQGR